MINNPNNASNLNEAFFINNHENENNRPINHIMFTSTIDHLENYSAALLSNDNLISNDNSQNNCFFELCPCCYI